MGELSAEERKEIALETLSLHFPKGAKIAAVKEGGRCSIFRVLGEGAILKVAASPRLALETFFYDVLQKREVPAVAGKRLNENVLYLEDLAVSKNWRLAVKEDLKEPAVGEALAVWYQAWHEAGRAELAENPHLHTVLRWEYSAITAAALADVEKMFALKNDKVWQKCRRMAPLLIARLKRQVDTFTYNDFYYVNLAVAKKGTGVALFDFDHSGKGLAASDFRNVASSLRGEALKRFQAAMPVDKDILAADGILAVLFELIIASRAAARPRWAEGVIAGLGRAEFRENLQKARNILEEGKLC